MPANAADRSGPWQSGQSPHLSLRAALLTWSSLPSLPVVKPLEVKSVNSCTGAGPRGAQEHNGHRGTEGVSLAPRLRLGRKEGEQWQKHRGIRRETGAQVQRDCEALGL